MDGGCKWMHVCVDVVVKYPFRGRGKIAPALPLIRIVAQVSDIKWRPVGLLPFGVQAGWLKCRALGQVQTQKAAQTWANAAFGIVL